MLLIVFLSGFGFLVLLRVFQDALQWCLQRYMPLLVNAVRSFLTSKNRIRAKIVLTFFQIISTYVGSVLDPPWPAAYEAAARKFDIANFNVLSLSAASCAIKVNYAHTLVVKTFGPLLATALIFLYYIISRAVARCQRALSVEKKAPAGLSSEAAKAAATLHTCTSLFLLMTYIVYPSVSLTIFRSGFMLPAARTALVLTARALLSLGKGSLTATLTSLTTKMRGTCAPITPSTVAASATGLWKKSPGSCSSCTLSGSRFCI